jgi:hypothetical protein
MPGWLRSEQVAGLRRNRWLASSESALPRRIGLLCRPLHFPALLVDRGQAQRMFLHLPRAQVVAVQVLDDLKLGQN